MRERTSKIEVRRNALVGWEVVVERVATTTNSAGEKYAGFSGTTRYSCPTAREVSAIVEFALEN